MEFAIDPADVATYRRDGFVRTDNVLSAAEISQYRAEIDREIERRTADDTRSVNEKTTYEQSFIQCMRLWETTPSVAPLTFHQRLAEMAASLTGEARLLLWQDQALYKEPGGRVTTAHQDQPFWPIGDAPLISAWIPLVDVTAELGAMAYVPGSHKAGRLRPVDITHSTEPYDILSDPALGGAEPQTVTAPAGSVIWHDGYTVHEAHPNRSNDIRKAFTIVYLAAGYRRAKDWPVFPLDRAGVKIGELMEGPGMPQVWPPPEDGIPTPDWTIGRGTGAQI